jgi:hypothetical protein
MSGMFQDHRLPPGQRNSMEIQPYLFIVSLLF